MSDEKEISFAFYAIDTIIDLSMGILLGYLVNTLADKIAATIRLGRYTRLIIQIMISIVLLYSIKHYSRQLFSHSPASISDLYRSWRGPNDYGIVFISMFLASQKNLIDFLEYIYKKEGQEKIDTIN